MESATRSPKARATPPPWMTSRPTSTPKLGSAPNQPLKRRVNRPAGHAEVGRWSGKVRTAGPGCLECAAQGGGRDNNLRRYPRAGAGAVARALRCRYADRCRGRLGYSGAPVRCHGRRHRSPAAGNFDELWRREGERTPLVAHAGRLGRELSAGCCGRGPHRHRRRARKHRHCQNRREERTPPCHRPIIARPS